MAPFTLPNDADSIDIVVKRTSDHGFILAQDNDLIFMSDVQLATLLAKFAQKKVASR
jgi:hypothetical protein